MYLVRIYEYRVRCSHRASDAIVRRVPQVIRMNGGAFTLNVGGILVIMSVSQLQNGLRPFVGHVGLAHTVRVRG